MANSDKHMVQTTKNINNMKKKIIYFLTSFFIFLGCKKNDDSINWGDGCIKRIYQKEDKNYIEAPKIDTVNRLFNNNQIDHSHLSYNYYTRDSIINKVEPAKSYLRQVVNCSQFTNGQLIFNGNLTFIFINGVIDKDNLYGSPGLNTKLDTISQLNLNILRSLFLTDIEKYNKAGHQFADSCLVAKFGYYYNPSKNGTLIKAWEVRENSNYYDPVGYYNDEDGKLLYFFDGIIF